METLMHYHWFRCKNSHCFHLVLGNALLTFSPEQLLVVAKVIDEMRNEINTNQIANANLDLTGLLM